MNDPSPSTPTPQEAADEKLRAELAALAATIGRLGGAAAVRDRLASPTGGGIAGSTLDPGARAVGSGRAARGVDPQPLLRKLFGGQAAQGDDGPARVAAGGGEVLKLLAEIRDKLSTLALLTATGTTAAAGQGSSAARKTEAAAKGYGWKEALRPITDPIKNSRVGQAVGRFVARARPAARATRRGLGYGGRKRPAAPSRAAASQPAGGRREEGRRPAGGGMASGAAGGVVAFGAMLVELARAGMDLAHAQESKMRALAEYSPSQAANLQELDVNRVRRSIQHGESTAGSGRELTQAIDRMEKMLGPFQVLADNVANMVGAGVADAVADIAEILTPMVKVLEEIAKKLVPGFDGLEKKDGNGIVMFGDWLKDKTNEQEQKAIEARRTANRLRWERGQP